MGMLFGAIAKRGKLRGPDKWNFAKWYMDSCMWLLTTEWLPDEGSKGVPVYSVTGKPFLEVRAPTPDDATNRWPLHRIKAVIHFTFCETLSGAQFKVRIPQADDVSTMSHFHAEEAVGHEEGEMLDQLEANQMAGSVQPQYPCVEDEEGGYEVQSVPQGALQ